MTLTLTPLIGIPLVHPGDDLSVILLQALKLTGLSLQDGDILVLAQKIVSKSEGRHVHLSQVTPSPRAVELAILTEKDPRLVELVLRESREVLRTRPGTIIVEHRLGFICANAGIDHSNVGSSTELQSDEWVLLLPQDPDASAHRLRRCLEEAAGATIGVLIIDSHGRAWRLGTVGVAIGMSGLPGLADLRGQPDLFGYRLRITEVGVADELAAAASLVMGQAGEGTPAVHVRGFPYPLRESTLSELIRPKNQDLFREEVSAMSPKDSLAPGFDLGDIKFAARPDTIDFRDLMYIPTLVEVPRIIPLENYQSFLVPILDQGREGACTGFGLATVANYLLRTRDPLQSIDPVSPRMLYEMARRYDEWPGENYSGSSARGAMKGWHKHGVCSENTWKYVFNKPDTVLTPERADEAANRPLGAYFRVNHKDLVSMHCAIAEVGILYASGKVHEGWAPNRIQVDGSIPYEPAFKITGGHAFAVVAYDEHGFWIQNSWTDRWGKGGFGRISYDDWLANGTDVWVARLGVPVQIIRQAQTTSASAAPATTASYVDLRPHVISLGNNGALKPDGQYGTCEDDVETIILQDIPRLTQGWKKTRIFLYAHGGLVPESVFLQRISDYRATMFDQEVYPLGFVWHSDFWSTATDIAKDAFGQVRPEGALDNALDFLLDRLDDSLERLVRKVPSRAFWDEMKENAVRATTTANGGARFVLKQLAKLAATTPNLEIHVGGHSAGGIFMAPFVRLLTAKGKITSGPLKGATGFGLPVASCTLWAPGITMDDFKATYLPVIESGAIDRFALYTLTDEAERSDNVGKIYNKSLLYMVSNALEDVVGKPLLGLARDVDRDKQLVASFNQTSRVWILAPTEEDVPLKLSSNANSHGAFDDDPVTVKSTLLRILNVPDSPAQFRFARSSASLRNRRKQLDSLPH